MQDIGSVSESRDIVKLQNLLSGNRYPHLTKQIRGILEVLRMTNQLRGRALPSIILLMKLRAAFRTFYRYPEAAVHDREARESTRLSITLPVNGVF